MVQTRLEALGYLTGSYELGVYDAYTHQAVLKFCAKNNVQDSEYGLPQEAYDLLISDQALPMVDPTPTPIPVPPSTSEPPPPTPTPTPTPAPKSKSTSPTEPAEKKLSQIRFKSHRFKKGQTFKIYSAPSESSWYTKTKSGAQGVASTNDVVYVAGRDGKWLLVRYEITEGKFKGSYRMGYTKDAKKAEREEFKTLSFNNYPGKITKKCSMTNGIEKVTLNKGTEITVLGEMDTGIYIETTVEGRQLQGVVPESCVDW